MLSRKSRPIALLAAALLVTALGACQTTIPQSTTVDRVFRAPQVENAPYEKVLVVGMMSSREAARNIETALVQHLTGEGVRAYSFVRESDSTVATEEAIRELVESTRVTGVIIVSGRLAGAEIQTRNDQIDVSPQVRGGGDFFDYFNYDYKESEPSSYSNYTLDVVFMTDFFDAATHMKIHSVESSTVRGQTNFDIIMAEGEAIVERLKKDDIIG